MKGFIILHTFLGGGNCCSSGPKVEFSVRFWCNMRPTDKGRAELANEHSAALGSNNVQILWELVYGCQLVLWQWLCQHRSLLHYDVVVQVLCIITLEQLCHVYHKSYLLLLYYWHQQTCSKNENIIMILLLVNIYGENQHTFKLGG